MDGNRLDASSPKSSGIDPSHFSAVAFADRHAVLGITVKNPSPEAEDFLITATEDDVLFFDTAANFGVEVLRPTVKHLEDPKLESAHLEDTLALVRMASAVDFGKFDRSLLAPTLDNPARLTVLRDVIRTTQRELNLLNLTIPEQLGGQGLSLRKAALVIAGLTHGARSGGIATSLMCNELALTPILLAGTADQQRRFVRESIEREELSSYALTEAEAGSNPAEMQSRLEDKGDHYLLSGTKQWITNHKLAAQFLVFAKMANAPQVDDKRKICCLVVRADSPGITVDRCEEKLGQHCSPTGSIRFDNVKVPKDQLIGKPGEGLAIALRTLGKSRPLTAAIGLGLIGSAREIAVEYARTRQQGGQPIINYQLVQEHLVNIDRGFEEVKLLMLQALACERFGSNANGRQSDSRRESSHAKLSAGIVAEHATSAAIQILGGNGYSEEYLASRLYRDARVLGVYEGTNEIQKLIIGSTFKS
jgi:alkylation response protein AidB-like acyl-CoA dehydrogenase